MYTFVVLEIILEVIEVNRQIWPLDEDGRVKVWILWLRVC